MDAASIATICGGLAVLITSLEGVRQNRKTNGGLKENTKITKQVHNIVNSRQDKLEARIEQLAEALQASGAKIPPKPDSAT